MGDQMTGLPENIEELLTELVEKSRHEMNIVLALADAIRRTDEQLLREVRSVTLSHEMRRAEIRSELQALSSRLCAFPPAQVSQAVDRTLKRPQNAIPNDAPKETPPPPPRRDSPPRRDWGNEATDIELELTEAFGEDLPRH